jgi:hypothetical protein
MTASAAGPQCGAALGHTAEGGIESKNENWTKQFQGGSGGPCQGGRREDAA